MTQDSPEYERAGIWHLEVGDGVIGKVDLNFFDGPSPPAAIHKLTLELRGEKIAFGATLCARWFGLTG